MIDRDFDVSAYEQGYRAGIHDGQKEIAELRAEIIQLEKWNGEIAFNARLFADALKEIRDAGPMTLDDQRWRIALAALGGAND